MRGKRSATVVLAMGLALGCRETVELDPGTALCSPIGEPCVDSAACCSHACANDGSGLRVCEAIGGCLEPGEICRHDADCCGRLCANVDPSSHLGQCADSTSCAVAGEVCAVAADPSATRECCAATGAAGLQCHATGSGIDRCRARGMPTCSESGATCDAPEDCCSRICVDTGTGTLTCEALCREGGESCTRSADCCTGRCHDALCTGTRSCAPLGATCADSPECCSGACSGALCQAPLI